MEMTKKKDLLEKKINYIKLGKLSINLPISGFIKSRVLSFFFFSSISPLYFLLKKEKPDYLIIHLLTSIPCFINFF